MDTTTHNDIASLISSRICHDLISPLGAIGNGVELLGMAGTADGPEMALINESVMNANARIRFFRIAFGAAKVNAQIGRSEIIAILTDISAGGRLKFDWDSDQTLPRAQAKLAFLLILCFETALPYGGTVEIRQCQTGWSLHCTAEQVKFDPAIWELLLVKNSERELSPAEVHFALVADVAKRAGCKLQTDLRENAITATFNP